MFHRVSEQCRCHGVGTRLGPRKYDQKPIIKKPIRTHRCLSHHLDYQRHENSRFPPSTSLLSSSLKRLSVNILQDCTITTSTLLLLFLHMTAYDCIIVIFPSTKQYSGKPKAPTDGCGIQDLVKLVGHTVLLTSDHTGISGEFWISWKELFHDLSFKKCM